MWLKRIMERKGDELSVKGIKVLHASDEHHFSPRLIEGGVSEGWLSMGKGKITIHGEGGDVVYNIARAPGYYCCHCNMKLDDGGVLAQSHVATHKAKKSPDKNNPAGYRKDNFYAGTLGASDKKKEKE
jgi:hypothetical protein